MNTFPLTARLGISARLLRALLLMLLSSLPINMAAALAEDGNNLIQGTVLETMDAAGYTYVNISSTEGPLWIAIPETRVSTGEQRSFAPGMEMKDFQSTSLNKTFSRIIFSEGIVDVAASAKPDDSNPSSSFEAAVQAEKQATPPQVPAPQASGGSMGAIAPFSEISVEKAEGENSFTVAELFEKAAELNGTKVIIRGKVVKFNANIMGRNWLHLQDGTGDPMNNTHDLVVTTATEIGSPDVVTIEGVLSANKDFGAGYTYTVIVENASVLQ